ncbi:uncharacterized protein DNG_03513 [Cephalotrichum gorgonifer]|uniref:Branchpoint-bridging protein n=1 Tax=Cephalotrichum gorgonifer TaxID=2041049 RepID=A0AAE8SUC5_9PEZI|nr:uncharacterized protein DNG_03513 [Cephalotrichum gorgonifer]
MERGQYQQSSSRPYPWPGKRLTRWGPETSNSPTSTYGFSTALPGSMTSEQQDAYVTALRIEEITQKLRANDDELLISVENGGRAPRSPSPASQYDSSGCRTNTRVRRYRERPERERHGLVQAAVETIPGYRPPRDYHQPVTTKIQDRVYLPVADFPHVNFIGQILGPRGSSLKAMNSETGATIIIRGRGSVKEGRRRGYQAAQEREQEPLHCLVTANSQQKVSHAKSLIWDVIENAISMPDELNSRKNAQLRGLAIANGTFRDDEGRSREPGGFIEHRV